MPHKHTRESTGFEGLRVFSLGMLYLCACSSYFSKIPLSIGTRMPWGENSAIKKEGMGLFTGSSDYSLVLGMGAGLQTVRYIQLLPNRHIFTRVKLFGCSSLSRKQTRWAFDECYRERLR